MLFDLDFVQSVETNALHLRRARSFAGRTKSSILGPSGSLREVTGERLGDTKLRLEMAAPWRGLQRGAHSSRDPAMTELRRWLRDLGLEAHIEAFEANRIGFDLLPELGEADLKELGIVALGDRKRLLKAIAVLPPGHAVPAAAAVQLNPPGEALPSRSDAERRQLTVMFCDLVGSTVLANRLDPEDWQGVISGYHDAVSAAVAPFDGHVAQLLGDGVLVYFGYPHAHEDDADRAVRAALAVLQTVARLAPSGNIGLQTRIGIATGLVVVGEIGAGTPAAERSASGETPNLAARLQACARPGEIVLAAQTRRLIGGAFELEPMGELELKGFAEPIPAWRVLGERALATRFEAQHAQELTEFIGRDSEVALLLERWAMAREGEGQLVLLSGEAGIGKSRICQTLRERLASEPPAIVLLQCSPYFTSSALHPVIQHLGRTAGIASTDSPDLRAEKMERLAMALPGSALGYVLRLMGLPDGGRTPPSGQSPQQDKAQTFKALIDMLIALAQRQPVLYLVEDVHWIDPTTEEFIAQTIDRARDSPVLILVTCRPEYAPSWGSPAHLTRLTLSRLGQKQCASLVTSVAGGKPLPAAVLNEIMRKTEGIPLFVEELTKTVIQSGLLEETPSGYRLNGPLPALAIPSTLQDSLMARLDRLAPAKEVAHVGAAIGREFSHELLAAVLSMPEAGLCQALDELVRSELLFRRGSASAATYVFKHALIRDTAYNSMLKSQRVLRHGQIAAALVRVAPDTAATQPELLAYHYQEGGMMAAALEHWSAAGYLAVSRSASREAVMHFRSALGELARMDEAPAQPELDLRMQLGNALMQTEGYGAREAYACYERARVLASQLGRVDQYVIACAGVGPALQAEGRFRDIIEMFAPLDAEQLSRLEPMSRVSLQARTGVALFHRGELKHAWEHLSEARRGLVLVPLDRQQPLSGAEPMVLILAYCSRARAPAGFLEQSARCTEESLQYAESSTHVPTRTLALQMLIWTLLARGDTGQAIERAHELLEASQRYGLKTRVANALFSLGRAFVAIGEPDEGMRKLREGYALWAATGGKFHCSSWAAEAAEALLDAGRAEDALEFVLAGEKVQNESEECHYRADLLRLRGRLCDLRGDTATAEERYREAIAIAQVQDAKLFALRAALNLATMYRSPGSAQDGATMLKAIYESFTEGFDYADLRRARALLDEIGFGHAKAGELAS